jgi:predicted permease
MTAWNRLCALLQRKQLDGEFDREAESHLDLATEDYIRCGYPATEARRLARVKFGAIEAAKDAHRDSRGIAWIESIFGDLRYALRGLWRDRAYATTAILLLSLAIGLNLTAFSVMNTMLFRGFPLVKDNYRLLYIQERKTLNGCCLLYPDFVAWREQAKAFAGMAFVGSRQISLSEGNSGARVASATAVTANTLSLLGVKPLLGRDFLPADELPGASQVVMLPYRVWQARFGGRTDIIGQVLRVDKFPATIIGVTPEGFDFPERGGLWMPLHPTPEMLQGKPGGYLAFGRLAEGATQAGARTELEAINSRLEADFPATNKGVRPRVDTYAEFFIGPEAKMIYGSVWVAAWFVLLIAFGNLANLTLARTLGRSREFSTRLALGAGHLRMVRQIFAECLLLAAAGGFLSWWLAKWALQAWAAATSTRYVVLDYTVGPSTVFYLAMITLAAALLIGSIPAIKAVVLDVNGVLKSEARGVTVSRGTKRLSAALVAGQMALAVVLLAGAGVLTRSLWNIVSAETGVTGADKVLIGSVSVSPEDYASPGVRNAFWDRLRASLTAIPGVESESLANTIPVDNPGSVPFELDDRRASTEQQPRVTVVAAGSGYLHTVGASTITGREFTDADDPDTPPVAMVNQSFANQYWRSLEPLNRRVGFRYGSRTIWLTVVGVTSNIMQDRSLRDKFVPIVYVPFRQNPMARAAVFIRTIAPANQVAAKVRKAIEKADPGVMLEDYSTLQASFGFDRDRMDLEHGELGKLAAVAPIFAGVALVLAVVGLYAVVANSVGQQTKEIGVRMALGATSREIQSLVLWEAMAPVIAGLVLGLATSLGVNRILQSQLIGVSPYDAPTLVLAPLILTSVALMGAMLPVRQASRVDPAVTLRHE